MDRRKFLTNSGMAAGALLVNPLSGMAVPNNPTLKKRKVALVGTGIRGVNMFGRDLLRDYGQYIDMVGLCDINTP